MKPLLLIGQGARGVDLVPIIEKLNLPVATTWNAMDMIPYDHPLCVGRPGTVSMPLANWAVDNCDYLLTVGARLDNIVTRYSPETFAKQAVRTTVDIDEYELAKHPGKKLLCDGADFLRALEGPRYPDWIEVGGGYGGKYLSRNYPSSGPISHYQLVEALSELLPEGQLIVTGSSGLAIEAFYQTFRNKTGQRIFHTTGLGAMGYGLPASIGACLASGRKTTVLFESDGSLMFAIQNLATIRKLNLPITIIVANNGGYASMRATQRNYFEGRHIATGDGMPELCDVALAFGIPATLVEDIGEWRTWTEWNVDGPHLVSVNTLPNEVLSPKVGVPLPSTKPALRIAA